MSAHIHSGVKRCSFKEDDSGQITLFVAIFALTLVAVAALPIPVGQVITARIQAQNAADAAAVTAVTWTARGDNLMQGLNGVLWDADYTYITSILLSAAASMAELDHYCAQAANNPFNFSADYQCIAGETGGWSGKWRRRKKLIKGIIKAEKETAKAVASAQKATKEGIPYLAYMEANQMAKNCGAGVFNPANISEPLLKAVPILGDVIKQLGTIIAKAEGLLPDGIKPYCWVVSPDFLNPADNHQFCEETEPSGVMSSPLRTKNYNPFAECVLPPLFLYKNMSWKNNWYKSTNRKGDTPNTPTVTYITTIDRQPSFALNKLFQGDQVETNAVGAVSAVGSATYQGSTLQESGYAGGATYIAFGMGAVQVWPLPPLFRVTNLGSWNHFGGDCDTSVVPVKILGHTGSDFAIFH